MPAIRLNAGVAEKSTFWSSTSLAAVVLAVVILAYILFVEASPPKSLSYMDEYYNLRIHLDFVHRGLEALAKSS